MKSAYGSNSIPAFSQKTSITADGFRFCMLPDAHLSENRSAASEYFSPENETITINFSENTNGLIVTFKNWAICPTDDEMQKLTERGYRSSIIRQKTNINGSGLGLYLLKQLCQSNNVEFNISKGNELKMISGVKYNPFIVTLTFRNA